MASPIQAALEIAVQAFSLPPELQDFALQCGSKAAPMFMAFNQRAVTFERHPLYTLHHLVHAAIQEHQTPDLSANLYAVPEPLRNAIYYEVWSQAIDSNKGGDRWGERHALSDLPRLQSVIETVVKNRLESLPSDKANDIYGTIYRMAQLPNVPDPKWGEHHAKEDPERLIRALHRNQCLDIAAAEIPYCLEFEKYAQIPTQPFQLYRPDLARGKICFLNGMGTSFETAKKRAIQLSDDCAGGRNIHCVYSSSSQTHWDIATGFLGQGGVATPAVIELLEQWQDFFETNDQERLLQLCTSRGAAEVNNALNLLPEHLKQRMIVITIAPACLIPAESAYKVVNLVILADPVVQIAINRHLIDAPHTIKLDLNSNTLNPHDMNGSSYRDWLLPRLECYIHINDIYF